MHQVLEGENFRRNVCIYQVLEGESYRGNVRMHQVLEGESFRENVHILYQVLKGMYPNAKMEPA